MVDFSDLDNKFLYVPCILSGFLTLTSMYFFNKRIVETKTDEVIEVYYEIAMQFAKVGSLIFNICCFTFLVYVCFRGGYFLRFSRRSYRFHTWLGVLTLLILLFTIGFLLTTSGGQFTNIEVLLGTNSLHCFLIIGSLWEQRVRFEAFIHKLTKESRQPGKMPMSDRSAVKTYRNVASRGPSDC